MSPKARRGTPPAYLSSPWIEAARDRVESDAAFLKEHVGNVDLSLLLVVVDRPGLDGEAVFIEFRRGRLVRVEWGPRADLEKRLAPRDFTISGAYETFARIHQGAMTERAALLTGKLRVQGSMSKALSLLRSALSLNKLLREIPARYE